MSYSDWDEDEWEDCCSDPPPEVVLTADEKIAHNVEAAKQRLKEFIFRKTVEIKQELFPATFLPKGVFCVAANVYDNSYTDQTFAGETFVIRGTRSEKINLSCTVEFYEKHFTDRMAEVVSLEVLHIYGNFFIRDIEITFPGTVKMTFEKVYWEPSA